MSSCPHCGGEIKNYGLFRGGIRCPNRCTSRFDIPQAVITAATTPLTLREDQKREAAPAKDDRPKCGQGCRIARYKNEGGISRGQCEACGNLTQTRYTLTIGQNSTLICPTCKATLRQDIDKIDHEFDCP